MTTTHTPSTFNILRAQDRGRTRLGWLDSWHSFSFGGHHDPSRMGYRALRVINDDIIAPGGGFGEHPHRDMEILTWVLDGALRHGDSMENSQAIRRGELQRMSAGRGIRHSEFNASSTDPVHLLQVWIEPSERGLEPAYGQREYPARGRANRWQTLATGRVGDAGDDGPMPIHQDAAMRVADLDPGASLSLSVEAGRFGYVQVATGSVSLAGESLHAGDAAEIAGPAELRLVGDSAAQVLVFDLA